MSLDLSAHHALLIRRGFSIPDLRAMSLLASPDLKKLLKKSLAIGVEEGEEVKDGPPPLHLAAPVFEIKQLGVQGN
jgi:hypothetical protein